MGLARRLRDSPTLQEAFERYLEVKRAQAGSQKSTKTRLDCRVPTRWNSDCTCLSTHMELYPEMRGFIQDPDNNLKHYFLNTEQVKLAEHLCEALLVSVPNHNYLSYLPCAQIFKDISDRFSQAEVPLAYEVIPMLEGLEHELQNLQNDCEVPDMIRIAAQAALIMVGKYYALTDDCEVYRISISESDFYRDHARTYC